MKKHGLRYHPLYMTWLHIKARCINQRRKDFKYYGGRGITICDEWRCDFKAFYDYVMALENAMQPNLSIDRIRNNEGYKPGNLRWADKHTQRANTSVQCNNTSGYVGVYYHKKINKWQASIGMDNTNIHLKFHDTPELAAQARNAFIIKNRLFEYPIQNLNQSKL